jgi:hypothetical protein
LVLCCVRGSGQLQPGDDRAERRGVLLYLGEPLRGELALVNAGNGMEVGVAEPGRAELIDHAVLDLRLSERRGRRRGRREAATARGEHHRGERGQ